MFSRCVFLRNICYESKRNRWEYISDSQQSQQGPFEHKWRYSMVLKSSSLANYLFTMMKMTIISIEKRAGILTLAKDGKVLPLDKVHRVWRKPTSLSANKSSHILQCVIKSRTENGHGTRSIVRPVE